MVSVKELFNYYQSEGASKHQFRTELEHPFHRKRYKLLRNLINAYATGTVLDIGCAEGWLTLWSLGRADFAIGIDLSTPKIKRAIREAKDPKTAFIIASFDNLPFKKEAFNTIIWSEGPEHAVNPEKVLEEIFSLLKDEGVLITSTMGLHPPLLYKILRQLMGQWKTEVDDWLKWGHVSTFSRKSFLKLMSKHFVIVINLYLGPLIILPIRRLQKLFDIFLQKLTKRYVGSPWPGFGCILVVARKSEITKA